MGQQNNEKGQYLIFFINGSKEEIDSFAKNKVNSKEEVWI